MYFWSGVERRSRQIECGAGVRARGDMTTVCACRSRRRPLERFSPRGGEFTGDEYRCGDYWRWGSGTSVMDTAALAARIWHIELGINHSHESGFAMSLRHDPVMATKLKLD